MTYKKEKEQSQLEFKYKQDQKFNQLTVQKIEAWIEQALQIVTVHSALEVKVLTPSWSRRSGKVIWECAGLTGNCIPCPVVEGDLVFCMSGYKGYSLLALPLWAKGDITDSPLIKWTHNRGTPYVPSPLLYDGYLYFNQSNTSILSCRRAQTGDVVFDRTRIPGIGQIYASPVGANGRVYIPGRRGTTVVLERGKEFKVLATNKLDDPIDASPALAGTPARPDSGVRPRDGCGRGGNRASRRRDSRSFWGPSTARTRYAP